MALPPTKVYKHIASDPKATYKSLLKAGLLNESTIRNEGKELMKSIESTVKWYYQQNSQMPGPNLADNIAHTLHPFLNEKGIKESYEPWYGDDDPGQKPSFWKRLKDKLF